MNYCLIKKISKSKEMINKSELKRNKKSNIKVESEIVKKFSHQESMQKALV